MAIDTLIAYVGVCDSVADAEADYQLVEERTGVDENRAGGGAAALDLQASTTRDQHQEINPAPVP